eukprot:11487750-Heterocapsa_arctica.AAC.1
MPPPDALVEPPGSRAWYRQIRFPNVRHFHDCSQAKSAVSTIAASHELRLLEPHVATAWLHQHRHQRTPASRAQA